MSINFPKTIPRLSAGFSLIELTVALLIVVLLAGIALRSTNELSFQVRYEQTQERLNRIKEAIIGNPSRTVNGQPDISGFVADMGRLPLSIRELIDINNYCSNKNDIDETTCEANGNTWFSYCSNSTYSTQAACETNGGIWLGRKSYGLCSNATYTNQTLCLTNGGVWTHRFYGGWNGPYLNVSGNPASSDAFTDGWGKEAASATDQSYGWSFASDVNNNLSIQSSGKNQTFHAADTGYDADYPQAQPAILAEDWRVDISGGISVSIANTSKYDNSCGFVGPASTYDTQEKCENAGGSWSGLSCTFGQDSCKTVGGKWNDCIFSPSACSATGGTLQAGCQFTARACDAAGGSWDTNTSSPTYRTCLWGSTSCGNAGGYWNSTATRCDFNETSCSSHGGAWATDCIFTSATCPTGTTGVTWETAIKPDSCNFTQAACISLNGTLLGNDYCYLTHGENSGAKYDLANCSAAAGSSWTRKICLKVFYRENGQLRTTSSQPVEIEEIGGYQTMNFSSFSPAAVIPMGLNAIGIYEHDGTSCTARLYPFSRQQPIQVLFNAHSSLPVINW